MTARSSPPSIAANEAAADPASPLSPVVGQQTRRMRDQVDHRVVDVGSPHLGREPQVGLAGVAEDDQVAVDVRRAQQPHVAGIGSPVDHIGGEGRSDQDQGEDRVETIGDGLDEEGVGVVGQLQLLESGADDGSGGSQ